MNPRRHMFLISSLICLSAVNSQVDDPILVTLPEGQIRGQTINSPNNNTIYAFVEIPYAAPPVGELRFQAPAPPKKWDGVLDTTANSKICYQTGTSTFPLLEESEDCLYLNVYTPLKPGNSSKTPLPVLIWIHGGSYVTGTGAVSIYKPQYFNDHNIVVVTINYRLGPLGFLTTEDGIIPANNGLRDQHLAIQWVKKNINLFGGDPAKITISGESSGAASIALQLISPKNKGLIRGAILESGTALCQWSNQKYARLYAFELGQSLNPNFTSDDSKDLLKLLQSLPAAQINTNTITPVNGRENYLLESGGLVWVPVIEGENLEDTFLTGSFHENIKNGNINQIPILLGFNSEEMLFFAKLDPLLPKTSAAHFDYDLSNVIKNKFNMTKENKLTAGARLREIYTDELFEDDLGATIRFLSDESYSTPMTRHAKLQSNYTDVYLYQFSYKSAIGGLIDVEVGDVRGVGHTEELAYIWDYSYLLTLASNGLEPTPEETKIRHRLLTLWTNFVKYLNPTPGKDSFLDNVIWEKVTPNNLVYLNINTTLQMEKNPKEYLKWERIIDIYAIPPFITY